MEGEKKHTKNEHSPENLLLCKAIRNDNEQIVRRKHRTALQALWFCSIVNETSQAMKQVKQVKQQPHCLIAK